MSKRMYKMTSIHAFISRSTKERSTKKHQATSGKPNRFGIHKISYSFRTFSPSTANEWRWRRSWQYEYASEFYFKFLVCISPHRLIALLPSFSLLIHILCVLFVIVIFFFKYAKHSRCTWIVCILYFRWVVSLNHCIVMWLQQYLIIFSVITFAYVLLSYMYFFGHKFPLHDNLNECF